VPQLRIGDAAALLGVSDDTLRRWAGAGPPRVSKAPSGRAVVDGVELARVALELAEGTPARRARSARNSLRGIVTKVTRDTVMAQVELQAGPTGSSRS
jgi:predicted site-specific integrase-resolvase